MENITRIFIIPSRRNLFIQENVFKNAPIKGLAIALNTNSGNAGYSHESPFNCQPFHLSELRSIRNGRAIVSLKPTCPCRPYVTTMKAMNFNEVFLALPVEDFQKHCFCFFLFDFTTECSRTVALSRT